MLLEEFCCLKTIALEVKACTRLQKRSYAGSTTFESPGSLSAPEQETLDTWGPSLREGLKAVGVEGRKLRFSGRATETDAIVRAKASWEEAYFPPHTPFYRSRLSSYAPRAKSLQFPVHGELIKQAISFMIALNGPQKNGAAAVRWQMDSWWRERHRETKDGGWEEGEKKKLHFFSFSAEI